MNALPSRPTPATTRARPVIAAMLISTFMSAAEVTVISTAMPTIVSRLGGFDLFTWAFSIYLLGQAVTTPIYGRLSDMFGRRVVYLGSTALFLLSSLLCGLAWSMPSLIAFRALQGLGGGGLLPLATTIIGDVCKPEDRPRVLGYVSGIWGVAAIAGPLIGSLCVSTVGWPWVFWLNLPIGAVTMALVARHFVDPARTAEGGNVDIPGSLLLAGGVGSGMAALVQWEALSRPVLAGLAAICAACIAAFAVRERRARLPMLALHLLRRPTVLAANASGLICGALVIETTAFLPPVVQGVLGRDALAAGVVLASVTLSWTAASLGLGQVLVRLPLRRVALGAATALVIGSIWLAWVGSYAGLIAACIPLGLGLGATSLTFSVAVQNSVDTADRGRATSLFYFSRLLGQAIGAAALGGILNAGLARGGPAMHDALRELMSPAERMRLDPAQLGTIVPALGSALHAVFFAGVIVAVAAILVALIVPGRTAGDAPRGH